MSFVDSVCRLHRLLSPLLGSLLASPLSFFPSFPLAPLAPPAPVLSRWSDTE